MIGEYAYANNYVRLKALTDYTKDYGQGCPVLNMGVKFGWLAVWVPSPDWLCRIMLKCDVSRALR
jgi:hypothetical protein